MKFDKRLERLERKVPDPGCPTCRHRRGRLIFVKCRRQPDGWVKSLSPCWSWDGKQTGGIFPTDFETKGLCRIAIRKDRFVVLIPASKQFNEPVPGT